MCLLSATGVPLQHPVEYLDGQAARQILYQATSERTSYHSRDLRGLMGRSALQTASGILCRAWGVAAAPMHAGPV